MINKSNDNSLIYKKKQSTYYTPQKVNQARSNIQKYAWAKNLRDSALEKADKLLTLGYEYSWESVTPQSLPRSYGVNQQFGCLNCGNQIDRFGNYPYKIDVINTPWKIQCPNCNSVFPTNDFGAFYKSGLDEHNIFNMDRADKSLLKNVLYPEKGEQWGVDDGFGCVTEDGKRYTFIAYYIHWNWYEPNDAAPKSNLSIGRSLKILRDAYIYTGDSHYAVAGAVLLDRIADVYPDMDINIYPRNEGYLNSCGGSGKGKVIGCIWETVLVKDFLLSYDAFFPAMDEPELISFLSSKATQYCLNNPKNSAALIRRNIEDNIVRQVYPGVLNAKIRGNMGMHQSALAMAAVVLDTMPETKEWLDLIFKTDKKVIEELGLKEYARINIQGNLINDVDRDGHGNESAPGYNILWLLNYLELADILDGYKLYPEADLYRNPKFKKMFSAMYPLIMDKKYFLNVGDTGKTGNPSDITEKIKYFTYKAFEKYGDKIFAQMLYLLDSGNEEQITYNIFSKDPQKTVKEVKKIVNTCGFYKHDSINLSGYGFAVLRDGMSNYTENKQSDDSQRCRDLWIYYGRNTGHGHRDTLNIGLHAFGLDLAPDLGYPEFADSKSTHRHEWVNKTGSHNTVAVDKMSQGNQLVGYPINFDGTGERVKLFDIQAAEGGYPQTEYYRRTCIMVKADDLNSYIIDLFRVNGGIDHDYCFHGAEGTVVTEGLNLKKQANAEGEYIGSYSGRKIVWGERPENDSLPTPKYMGAGFHFLKNIDKDSNVSGKFSIDWNIVDTWKVLEQPEDIHLKITMLGSVDDVALADGIPPRNKPGNPKSLRYMVAHRKAADLNAGLNSLFTSIIEPYKNCRFIEDIRPVEISRDGQLIGDDSATGVKITLAGGRVDYIVQSLTSDITYMIDGKFSFRGTCGAYFEMEGNQTGYYLYNGTVIGSYDNGKPTCITGVVTGFTKALETDNSITIQLNDMDIDIENLTGNYIYVKNDNIRNACYLIKGIKLIQSNLVTFDIGDITLIRSFTDSLDFAKGYIYDITEGAEARIPFSVEKY